MSGHSEVPTKSEVVQKLQELIRGEISPGAASDWARGWITRLELISDPKVRRAIDCLYGADSPSTDRPYLYVRSDFERWLQELTG